MSNQGPNMEVAVASEQGRRDENQDSMSWKRVRWGELFIVADGMGGYKGGAIASKMTVEGVEKHLTETLEVRFEDALQEAVRRVNEQIYREAHSGNSETESMGSTVVVALIAKEGLQVGHVGDSRAYLFRNGRLVRLTKDHTAVQRMLDAGMLTAEEARNHPDASVLSRAVGSKPEVEIEIGEPLKLEEGDAILLCSDGLSGFVEDRQIRQTLQRQSNIQRVPEALVKLALKSGSDDNITLQFARFGREKWPIRVLPQNPITWAILSFIVLATLGLFLFVPPTLEFTASQASVKPGETIQLKWNAQFAQKVEITPEIGEVKELNGSRSVTPSQSKVYVHTPTGNFVTYVAKASRFWSIKTKSVQINVTPATVVIPATPTTATATEPRGSTAANTSVKVGSPTAAPQSTITLTFTATPKTVKPGEPVLLAWEAQNATGVRIGPKVGYYRKLTGSITVYPSKAVPFVRTSTGKLVTYEATAEGPGKSVKIAATVTVTKIPVSSPPAASTGSQPPATGSSHPPAVGGSQAGGSQPPATGGSQPPATGGSQPPATGGSQPPATGGSHPPAIGGSQPPTTGGSQPPATGGSQPPATGGSQPPATGGSQPPAGGSQPPPTGGQAPPPKPPQ